MTSEKTVYEFKYIASDDSGNVLGQCMNMLRVRQWSCASYSIDYEISDSDYAANYRRNSKKLICSRLNIMCT